MSQPAPRRRRRVVTSSEVTFEATVDVVVVGAGAAGYSTALNAKAAGVDVVMLEAADVVGGTTAKSAAWYWMPNNSLMREAGFTDPKPDALKYMARLAQPTLYRPHAEFLGLPEATYRLIEAFYDNAAAAADALRDLGALQPWHAAEIPDYYSHLPENQAPFGRVLQPTGDDGNPGFGDVMVACLQRAGERAQIPVLLQHRVRDVVVNAADEVVGVLAERADGTTVATRARRGVVFTTGGFAHNVEMRREFLFGPVFGSCAVKTSRGDFVRIASDLGAPLANMNYPWMAPMAFESALWGPEGSMCLFAPPGDSMVFVNRFGVRVVNEKLQYNEAMQAMQVWDADRAEYPNMFLFMVWDQAAKDLYQGVLLGNPIAPPGTDDSHVVSGQTFAELADAIAAKLVELDEHVAGYTLDNDFPLRLEQTVTTFNKYASDGYDPDFHRGEGPIQHYFNSFNGPPRPGNEANPLMAPFSDTGPYYATIIAPATLDTKGGPRINTHAQVLDADGEPVPGLYGAGNCIASPSGKAYWAGGATIGAAFTFGYLAAQHVVTQPERSA
jgi:3-oxosteroid 1-dehydrogenase